MTWQRSVGRLIGQTSLLFLLATTLADGNALAADKVPVGPDLATREIGVLMKGYPMLTQQNPLAPGGVGVLLWGCEYRVGKSMITITITTNPGDSMPCKRKVAFGDAPQKSPKGQ